jgi:alpha-1,6-mannosyltransferase
MTRRKSGMTPLLISGAMLLLAEGAALAAQYADNLHAVVVAALAAGLIWAAAAIGLRHGLAARRGAFAVVLAVAALLRIGALAMPAYLSNDVNRYVWDGRVAAAGINPYRYVPSDPHLAFLRDATIYPNINRSEYARTVYPPVAQMLFLFATRFGESRRAMRLAMVLVEAVGIWAMLRVLREVQRPREEILLYAWHPLPVFEIAGSGHVDAAVVAFVALALWTATGGRRALAGAALAAASLVKFFPVVLLPGLWRPRPANRGDWHFLAAFAAVVVLCYLPYLGVGARVLGFLPGYVREENLASGSGFWLLDIANLVWALPAPVYLACALAVMGGLAVTALARAVEPAATLRWAAVLAFAATVALSPHYAWYFVWLVAVLCPAPWWPAFWPTIAAFLLYWHPQPGRIPLWAGFTIYGGFAILALADLARRSLFPGARHDASPAR